MEPVRKETMPGQLDPACARINPWTATFADPALEARYQLATSGDLLKLNFFGLVVGMVLFTLFAGTDIINFEDPTFALSIRAGVLALSAPLVLYLRQPSAAVHQENIVMTVMILFGLGLNAILLLQPTLDKTYFSGIIQGAVLFGFILRISFRRYLLVFSFIFSTFVLVSYNKPPAEEVFFQSMTLGSVCVLCAFGVYLIQSYLRREYLNGQVIEAQNIQLEEMLEDLKLDNERKVAALSVLVHFVRTPIHQISGFTDVVIGELANLRDYPGVKGCRDSATYIKTASKELMANVTRLLEYHRLDDMERRNSVEETNLHALVGDAAANIKAYQNVELDTAKVSALLPAEAIVAALQQLIDNINDHANEAQKIGIRLYEDASGIVIEVSDDGKPYSEAEFTSQSQALNEVCEHLNTTGAHMPMGLRVARRAAEIAGGELCFAHEGDQNTFRIVLPVSAKGAGRNEGGSVTDLATAAAARRAA